MIRSKDQLGELGRAAVVGAAVGYLSAGFRQRSRELRRVRMAVEGERPKADVGGALAALVGAMFWVGALCSLVAVPMFGWFALKALLAWNLAELVRDAVVVLVCGTWVMLGLAANV